MKILLPLLLAALPVAPARAQTGIPAEVAAGALAAQPGEAALLPELRALVLLSDEPVGDPAAPGVHTGRVPALDDEDARRELALFLGRPVSRESLGRMETMVRILLGSRGRPFALVYTPPQDITDGTVRIVVRLAALEGDVRVDGHRWFARERYLGALRARPGEALDAAALAADLAWLNRNPFRRVTPVVEAGERPGTTRVTLRAEERFPLTLTAGYANTGTRATDEDRVTASLQWGDAFGRGDLLSYGFSADPRAERMRGHSLGYTAFLPWRHTLSLHAAHSTIDSDVPPPFVQGGRSWQVGARYGVPLRTPRPGWTQGLDLTVDFKYADNTLEFAAIPVTGNVTHVAQLGASYSLAFPAAGGRNDLRAELVVSPGGLTRHNDDASFDGSRPGARSAYAYARLGLRHQRVLAGGWSLTLSADTQFATGALLGSEQLAGGGAGAVRGYRESSAFGDWGVVGGAELHAPGFAVVGGRDQADAFVFLDAASLGLRGDDDGTDLAAAGLGLNYQFGRHLAVRASHGWQLKAIDTSRGTYSGQTHVAASLTW
jgi:hemolysin activation/secretion protein